MLSLEHIVDLYNSYQEGIFILTLEISFLFSRRNFAYNAHDVPVVWRSVIEIFVWT